MTVRRATPSTDSGEPSSSIQSRSPAAQQRLAIWMTARRHSDTRKVRYGPYSCHPSTRLSDVGDSTDGGVVAMDPDALAATVGNALITAVATDAWHQAVSATVSLWRRVHPRRAEAIEEELAETHELVVTARQEGDIHAERRLSEEWGSRLLRLVRTDPDTAAELQRLLDEVLIPLNPQYEGGSASVVMKATSFGQGDIFQAAGQQYIDRS